MGVKTRCDYTEKEAVYSDLWPELGLKKSGGRCGAGSTFTRNYSTVELDSNLILVGLETRTIAVVLSSRFGDSGNLFCGEFFYSALS